jgi:hypothetical protein
MEDALIGLGQTRKSKRRTLRMQRLRVEEKMVCIGS